jgi:2-polyprenyl-3-methyl-5-hydroxy-6-metoxy-1,4-benzoquinol methylase
MKSDTSKNKPAKTDEFKEERMNPEAMRPYGKALIDYYQGNASAAVTMVRDDGWTTELQMESFFRQAEAFELERLALNLCTGKILDVGAGAGLHSLFLQNKGFEVCAIDVIPESVRIMRERGISVVQQADVMTFVGGQFDTILMMGHGIGMVEDIPGLDRFLAHASSLLRPAGQLLLTSLDIRVRSDPSGILYQKRNRDSGRYFGEIRMQFRYGEILGPLFGWLQVDADTLKIHAAKHSWYCELVCQQEDGNYLARLTPIQ